MPEPGLFRIGSFVKVPCVRRKDGNAVEISCDRLA